MKKCIICNQNIEVIIDKDMEKVVCDECINNNHTSKADELLIEIFKTETQSQVRKAFKVSEKKSEGSESMKEYIGIKLVMAEPAFLCDGRVYPKDKPYPRSMNLKDGYRVIYKDGHKSWIPKEAFEEAYKPTKEI